MTEPDTAALRAQADRSAGAVSITTDTAYALCDGYDEAQRLRGDVAEWQRLEAVARRRQEQAVADRIAARQALADLIGELRGLCEDKTGWDFIDPDDLRAVIDRHDPAAT